MHMHICSTTPVLSQAKEADLVADLRASARLHIRFALVVPHATICSQSERWRSPEGTYPFEEGTTSALLVSIAIGRAV